MKCLRIIPTPATMKTRLINGFFVYRHLGRTISNISINQQCKNKLFGE